MRMSPDRILHKDKRKANKPLLERKRRARINDSLSDLKQLVLASLNKDASKFTKMEKVDILDMTVQFLKRRCFGRHHEDYNYIYNRGYTQGIREVYKDIVAMDGVDEWTKQKIMASLSSKPYTRPASQTETIPITHEATPRLGTASPINMNITPEHLISLNRSTPSDQSSKYRMNTDKHIYPHFAPQANQNASSKANGTSVISSAVWRPW